MSPPSTTSADPAAVSAMRRALELAKRGEGFVEPNPMVGAVMVAADGRIVGEGYHQRYGEAHAEVHALAQAGTLARGATLFVTLEPCCHHGQTPPCADAVIAAGIRRVVVTMQDPNPKVAGSGLSRLREAGIEVEVGLLEDEARRLTAPFCKLIETGMPFVHAKWAMTLDGKIASRTGASQWISGPESRAVTHRLRGRMDAIVVGIGTALADDPQLTARPPGSRIAARIVLDNHARLPMESQLVRSVDQAPVVVVTGPAAPDDRLSMLRAAGVEVMVMAAAERSRHAPRDEPHFAKCEDCVDVQELLRELGRRRFTNVLVEGGSRVLGAFFDQQLIEEFHVFIAPKLLGGSAAMSPLAGLGLTSPEESPGFLDRTVEQLGADVYIRGRVN
ncbi:MAG: bifunctional diaminohydroxyphosphoribosylaminopyrimidine deaminase/5-amino-6-(5-phosphoribosylamino)uracil reductase RibD [Planctomycetales bacterium]|nr:bifunctional diaminohydroxyphosphoribosylaminopyrimidine deaminase/5-amino-6-(5-phosphoribosylamino)uracil reductase RibD [Planctomycetales bacterium]